MSHRDRLSKFNWPSCSFFLLTGGVNWLFTPGGSPRGPYGSKLFLTGSLKPFRCLDFHFGKRNSIHWPKSNGKDHICSIRRSVMSLTLWMHLNLSLPCQSTACRPRNWSSEIPPNFRQKTDSSKMKDNFKLGMETLNHKNRNRVNIKVWGNKT